MARPTRWRPPLVVDEPEVTRGEPAVVGQHGRRGAGVEHHTGGAGPGQGTTPVAAHHRGGAEAHRPTAPPGTDAAVVVHHRGLDPGYRPADGGGDGVVGVPRHGPGPEGRLGGRVADDDRDAQRIPRGRPPARPGPATHPVPAMRSDDRSAPASSGRARTSAHWVGTPWATVIRSASMTATASEARHGVGVMTVVMPLAASSQVLVIEPTWAKGRGDSRRSPGSDSTSVPSATARRLSWSNTAPFGSPVVPLVHTTATGSDGAVTGHAAGDGPPVAAVHRARVRTAPVGPVGTVASSSTTVTTGRGPLEDGGDLGGSQALVDPRGDGPQPDGGGVHHHVVDRAREQQADDRPRTDAMGRQEARHAVGRTVPTREGERPTGTVGRRRLDVGLHVAVHPACGAQDVDQGGVLFQNLTRRHVRGTVTAAPGRSRPVPVGPGSLVSQARAPGGAPGTEEGRLWSSS